MATAVFMAVDLGPPGAGVSVVVNYDTGTLLMTGITYSNASAVDAQCAALQNGVPAKTYRLAAGSPQRTVNLNSDHLQLTPRVTDKPGEGQVTTAELPTGWAFDIRWPI